VISRTGRKTVANFARTLSGNCSTLNKINGSKIESTKYLNIIIKKIINKKKFEYFKDRKYENKTKTFMCVLILSFNNLVLKFSCESFFFSVLQSVFFWPLLL